MLVQLHAYETESVLSSSSLLHSLNSNSYHAQAKTLGKQISCIPEIFDTSSKLLISTYYDMANSQKMLQKKKLILQLKKNLQKTKN